MKTKTKKQVKPETVIQGTQEEDGKTSCGDQSTVSSRENRRNPAPDMKSTMSAD